ncbi:MAG: EF-P lysine aminoacylase GenX [Archangiaceae bacterium]|nr:EF-P lysine aminoacylase GenX [Archangiaceae bacterium]
MPSEEQWSAARARGRLYAALRGWFGSAGFTEVETPAMVALPGLEPHIDPFAVGRRWLHTSPEYAMKRLLADPGCPPIFQLCKVFRDEPPSSTHNPEFTMLELYRPGADYHQLMRDTEGALSAAGGLFAKAPYQRLTVQQAMLQHAGVDWKQHADAASFARAAGVRAASDDTWDDVFFRIFLDHVEPKLHEPTFITEYPASMASLARLKPSDASVAERCELYARGVELGNGFSELTDANEQRARLVDEQEQRRRAGRPVFALDEKFLEAVGRLPQCTGIAVGVDRVLMLLTGAKTIADVLLFPARDFGG